MVDNPKESKSEIDREGEIKTKEGGSSGTSLNGRTKGWLLAGAICLAVAVVILGLVFLSPSENQVSEISEVPVEALPEEPQRSLVRQREAAPRAGEGAMPGRQASREPGFMPRSNEVEGGVGIHAFPPLGTKPALTGIIVPDDFELPPGYVRHHQSSDDGQMLDPILMYHPTRPPVDEHGEPIEMPADRVVPPDMAPYGLPINILDVPETNADEPISVQRLLGAG